jgi:hypothetical protein
VTVPDTRGAYINEVGGDWLAVTQRGYFAPPFVSCMFAALCSLLRWAGYRFPLHRDETMVPPDNYVWALHKASGARLTSGTTIAHTRAALAAILPDAPVLFGTLSPTEFIMELTGGAAIRVTANAEDLCPLNLPAGCADVGHAYAICGTRIEAGQRQVRISDPMLKPGTNPHPEGRWVNWAQLHPALNRSSSGEIIVTLTYKDAASSASRRAGGAGASCSRAAGAV